jgi:acyl carrier protein
VAGIYAQVLGIERVGIDDSFFDLGGDSLSAMRVITAINTALDVGLAVRVLFDAPTVARLSFAQNRLWFLDQLHGPSPVYNVAVALRLRGRLDAEALGAALADVVGRHESLRTVFGAPDGIPQQLVIHVEDCDFGWQVVPSGRCSKNQAR